MSDLNKAIEKGRKILADYPQLGTCFSVSADYSMPIMDDKKAAGDALLKDLGIPDLSSEDRSKTFAAFIEAAENSGLNVAKLDLGPSGKKMVMITPRDGITTKYVAEKREFAA